MAGNNKHADFILRRTLHIDPEERYSRQPSNLDHRAKQAGVDPFLEEEPTVKEFLGELVPSRDGVANYLRSLFPSSTWIGRYNLHWLLGDSIAGLTVGLVVVPQAMAYASLARLSPEYGLYTSFTGAVLYWVFGTSKDIVIGTTAVGSLLVGSVVSSVQEKRQGVYSNEEIAKALSFVVGAILLFIGLFRLGWIIEFIPYVPISAFVTSAAITIMSTQLPVVLGITGIDTHAAPYKVIIETFKGLPRTKLDAACGLTSIALLFLIRDACAYMEKRQPHRKRMWGLISSLRLTFTVLLYTFISFLVHRTSPRGQAKFRIVGHIESGFQHAGVPRLESDLISLIIPELPAIAIILIIEHIAIAKSFGRTFNYRITPSQEVLAQGMANMFGPFVGGYVCTGSFGASAVLSKAGVRTPIAGVVSAMVLVLALYALTAVFYYIPNAALAGLIIHATYNLIAPPKNLYRYWQLSPLELIIWIVGVVLSLFISLETAIYVTIALSFVVLMVRNARSKGHFLGRLRVCQTAAPAAKADNRNTDQTEKRQGGEAHDVFLPIDCRGASNPCLKMQSPYPGVFIYRFSENLNYINQAYQVEQLMTYIYANTRPTTTDDGIKPRERLWCDTPPSTSPLDSDFEVKSQHFPLLRAVVLDCSAMNNIDITTINGLVDLRFAMGRHAAPAVVDWHFAGLTNRWTRRALAVAGFGFPERADTQESWAPLYTVVADEEKAIGAPNQQYQISSSGGVLEGLEDLETDVDDGADTSSIRTKEACSVASGNKSEPGASKREMAVSGRRVPVYGVDRPFFHVDLIDAVGAAVRDAVRKDTNVDNGQ